MEQLTEREVEPRSPAPGGSPDRVLVIGYGNSLRSDDGVGFLAALALADDPRLAGASVLALHQLTPELAFDVAEATMVVFIDASTDAAPGEVLVRELGAEREPRGARGADPHGPNAGAGPGATSHQLGPGTLLDLAREVFGATPPALVVSVGVATMEVGEGLSPRVEAALHVVADTVVGLVAERGRGRVARARAASGAGHRDPR